MIHKISPRLLFLVSLSFSLLFIAVMFLLFHLGNQLASRQAPLVDAAMEIKLEATIGHLWFEEIMAGDRNESIDSVWRHLDKADWYVNAMLNGGENDEGVFYALKDARMRASIISVRESLADFKDIAQERYNNIQRSIPGSDIDQKFDAIFEKFFDEADKVESLIQFQIKQELEQFNMTAFFLLSLALITSLLLSSFLYEREKNRTVLLTSLKQAKDAIETQNRELERRAHFDDLTGLPNRILYTDRLEHAVAHSQRKHSSFALLLIDLDDFKKVNDQHGHKHGDILLQQAASRIQHHIRLDDTLVRLSGDEFVVILYDIGDHNDTINAASNVASNILATMQEPFELDEVQAYVSASIGISIYPDDADHGEVLTRYADSAMYHAKVLGKNRYQFYSKELNDQAMLRIETEHDLRDAIKHDQLMVHYQPLWNLETEEVCGLEALVRWNHPRRGLVMPDDFIPIAEACGMIQEIDRIVMKKAMDQFKKWQARGYEFGRLALNVSPVYFCRPDFLSGIVETLTENGLQGENIALEITESVLFEDIERTRHTLSSLNKLGIRISIDDFGTGYSSMAYLRKFDVHTLKIDRSFIADYDQSTISMALLRNLVWLGRDLYLDVVAEGIETKYQQRHLLELGCSIGQGYLLSKPLPPEEVEYLSLPESSSNVHTLTFPGQ